MGKISSLCMIFFKFASILTQFLGISRHGKKIGSEIDPLKEPDVNPLNQLDRKERELEAARRISEVLFQHLNVEDLVEQGLKIALEVVTCRAGSVLLANPETKELVFYHSVGERPPKPGTAFPWSQGIAGTVGGSCRVDPWRQSDHLSCCPGPGCVFGLGRIGLGGRDRTR